MVRAVLRFEIAPIPAYRHSRQGGGWSGGSGRRGGFRADGGGLYQFVALGVPSRGGNRSRPGDNQQPLPFRPDRPSVATSNQTSGRNHQSRSYSRSPRSRISPWRSEAACPAPIGRTITSIVTDEPKSGAEPRRLRTCALPAADRAEDQCVGSGPAAPRSGSARPLHLSLAAEGDGRDELGSIRPFQSDAFLGHVGAS